MGCGTLSALVTLPLPQPCENRCVADDEILRRMDRSLHRIDQHMERGNEHMRRGNEHMRRGNYLMERVDAHMAENTRALEAVGVSLREMSARQDKAFDAMIRRLDEGTDELRAQRAALFWILDELDEGGAAGGSSGEK